MNAFLKSSLLSPALIEKTVTPAATRAWLMAFAADRETAASLEACLSQLTFPDAIVKSGGIGRAIRYLGSERSPDNIIVDISGTDMPASKVHDLDLQNGDCALTLNISPTPGLSDALANPLRIDGVFLERAMTARSERLFVLSAEEPLCTEVDFMAEAIETLVGVLRTQFHYIIVDVPRLHGAPYRRSLDVADIRVIVADQTLRSVRDTVRHTNRARRR